MVIFPYLFLATLAIPIAGLYDMFSVQCIKTNLPSLVSAYHWRFLETCFWLRCCRAQLGHVLDVLVRQGDTCSVRFCCVWVQVGGWSDETLGVQWYWSCFVVQRQAQSSSKGDSTRMAEVLIIHDFWKMLVKQIVCLLTALSPADDMVGRSCRCMDGHVPMSTQNAKDFFSLQSCRPLGREFSLVGCLLLCDGIVDCSAIHFISGMDSCIWKLRAPIHIICVPRICLRCGQKWIIDESGVCLKWVFWGQNQFLKTDVFRKILLYELYIWLYSRHMSYFNKMMIL